MSHSILFLANNSFKIKSGENGCRKRRRKGMLKQNFAVLQIGSGTLRLMVGRRGVSNTFIVTGDSSASYSGYGEGGFNSREDLTRSLRECVTRAEQITGEPITKLHVGVPTDFCRVVVEDAMISFERSHKISQQDIERLYEDGAKRYKTDASLRLINKAPIFFTTDNDRKLTNPLGVKTLKLGLRASYVFVETAFIEVFNGALREIGIGSVQYLSAALAEVQFLFDESTLVKPIVLLDIGNGNTSVIFAQGGGLLSMTSFACGGAFLTADLSMFFRISYDAAERLKSQVVLSLDANIKDKYPVVFKGKTRGYSALDTNSVIMDRLNQLADLIKRILDTSSVGIPHNQDLYLTGGGLLHVSGAKDYLAKRLEHNIIPVTPAQPLWDKPECSQILSLMDLTLDINNY